MSAFYRLPVELLTMIAECVIEEEKCFPEGKALRLTHPYFAHMGCLKAHLFHNVNFYATPEGLIRLKTCLPTEVKPFIKQITFIPSTYSTGMNFFHFRRIVITQWAGSNNMHVPNWHGGNYGALLEDLWDMDPIFSRSEVFAGFQKYHSQALEAQALLTDGSLDVWTDMIRELNVDTFRYGKVHDGESQDNLTTSRRYGSLSGDCKINMLHPHDANYHEDSFCLLNYARSQAQLVEPALACISNARAHSKKFTLSSAIVITRPHFSLPPNLLNLDLTSLRSLTWEGNLIQDGFDSPAGDLDREEFLLALLQKCCQTLQELKLVLDAKRPWLHPRRLVEFQLPALRRLHLESDIYPIKYVRWLAAMPSLESLGIFGMINKRTCKRRMSRTFPPETRAWKLTISATKWD